MGLNESHWTSLSITAGTEFLMWCPCAFLAVTSASFHMIYSTAGINRLLGNNTYEAAFPPHEVRRFFYLLEKL